MDFYAAPPATSAPVVSPAVSPAEGGSAEQPALVWSAHLELQFARRGETTRAVLRRHRGPLRVQRMLYPEGPACCHALLLHPPGGLAGGDALHVAVSVAPGAHALLTTPGAAKWYRCDQRAARQQIQLRVADGGCLEWLPQEAILFDGARAEQVCEIALAPQASMFGWDIVQLGRLAAGEAWRRGLWRQQLSLHRDDRPVWLERAALAADDALRASPLGLAGHPVFGTAWAAGPLLAGDIEAALAAARGAVSAHALPCGISWLPAPAELLVARTVGHSGHAVRALLETLWHTLRPWTAARSAQRPRIWAT